MSGDADIAVVDMGEYEDMTKAAAVAEILHKTYPGYLWAVASTGDVLDVKSLVLSRFGPYGFRMRKHLPPRELRWWAIHAGGELLERCGLPRDRGWDGVEPTHMEGADKRRQKW